MTKDFETQKQGYRELINLCSAKEKKEQLLEFIDTLTDHNGDEDYYSTLNYVMGYLDDNAIHLIMALDWKQEIRDLEWRVSSSLRDNYGLKIELPNPKKYGDNKSVSSPNVFKDFDLAVRKEGFQLSFIDTESDEYVIVVNKITDSDKVSNAIKKIGYNYFEADSPKINEEK